MTATRHIPAGSLNIQKFKNVKNHQKKRWSLSRQGPSDRSRTGLPYWTSASLDRLKTNLNLISFVISSVNGISIRFGRTIIPLRTEVIPALIAWYTPGAFATAIRPFILNFHWFTNWPIRNQILIIRASIWKPSSITGGSKKQIETFPTIGTSVISGSIKAFSKSSLDQSDESPSDGSQ